MRTAREIIENINSIYDEYKVPQNLRHHMQYVAAIGKKILSLYPAINSDEVVAALLLHDIANIVKYDFSPQYNLAEPIEELKQTQQEVIAKFGSNHAQANSNMIKDINPNMRIVELVENARWENAKNILESDDIELQICAYADYRVSPHGVVSLEQRFNNLHKRYQHRKGYEKSDEEVKEINKNYFVIEEQIFKDIKLKPTDITNESIQEFLEVKL